MTFVVPKDTIGYKKARVRSTKFRLGYKFVIVKLLIRAGSLCNDDVTAPSTRWDFGWVRPYRHKHMLVTCNNGFTKMRCNKATVLDITDMRGRPVRGQRVTSIWDPNFSYVRGRVVRPKRGFNRSADRCASGIHFYLSKAAARMH